MKKVDLAQAIALLANVGVIAGIIFLGYELHQNNEQLAADSRFNYYQTRVNFFRENATDEEFAEVWFRARTDLESLTPFERGRVDGYTRAVFTAWEYELAEFQRGLLSAEEFNVPSKRQFYRLQRSVFDIVWPSYRMTAPENFVRYMEEKVIPSDQ